MGQDLKVRYTDKELEEFRLLIEEKIEKAQSHLELLRSSYMNDGNNGTDEYFVGINIATQMIFVDEPEYPFELGAGQCPDGSEYFNGLFRTYVYRL